jgi:uncharacterized membrane protein
MFNSIAFDAPESNMTLELSQEQRLAFLKEEYLFLQSQYENYDSRSLTIKGWVTGGAGAALGFALDPSHKYGVLLLAFIFILVLVIWYLEACWKLFQYALTDRIRLIEAYFRSDPDILIKEPDPFQIYHWWFRSHSRDEPIYEYEKAPGRKNRRPRTYAARLRAAALQRFVCLPYLPIAAVCFASILLLLFCPSFPMFVRN